MMFDDIRLRPLCANGLSGHPPVRTLVQAMIDLGWPLKRRVEYLYELYGDDWEALRGCAPDATGDLLSEAFIRKLRDEWE